MKHGVRHEVWFDIGPDDPEAVVLRTMDGKYARLRGVTVHLVPGGRDWMTASGKRCRKDGERDRRMGNVYVPVKVPNEEEWFSNARFIVAVEAEIVP